MEIRALSADDHEVRERLAELLVEGFRELAPDAWSTIEEARETVTECLGLGPVLVAHDDKRGAVGASRGPTVGGWVGARPAYSRVWELHPMVVAPTFQRRGVGRELVAAIERVVAERGAMTLVLGSDDEVGLTSLFGVDLYPDPVAHLARLEDRGGHPFSFYRKCGFAVVGVTPDASGPGMHDIHMAKRVGR
jgi:aminoglycoside 6'-N-acetyltransferase I